MLFPSFFLPCSSLYSNTTSPQSLAQLSQNPHCLSSMSPLSLPGRILLVDSFSYKPLEGRDNIKFTFKPLPPKNYLCINVHSVNEYFSQRILEFGEMENLSQTWKKDQRTIYSKLHTRSCIFSSHPVPFSHLLVFPGGLPWGLAHSLWLENFLTFCLLLIVVVVVLLLWIATIYRASKWYPPWVQGLHSS